MATELEDVVVLRAAETIADEIWRHVSGWDEFARDVVGKQLTRAADSIGANIAESYGRYNYGEKVQFLYYARGSLFETKYWLNRVRQRNLLPSSDVERHGAALSNLARQLNAFTADLKRRRSGSNSKAAAVREDEAPYQTDSHLVNPPDLFTPTDLDWLSSP